MKQAVRGATRATASRASVVGSRLDKAAGHRDHPSVVRVLAAVHDTATLLRVHELLGETSGFEICADEATAVAAVARAVEANPDLCLLDIDIPGGGMAAAWEISARLPHTKIVLLTESHLGRQLVLALACGLSGYVRKDTDMERLPMVLEGVMAGEIAIPRASVAQIAVELREGMARRRSVAASPHSARLTSREWEVMSLLCDGQGTPGIARLLGISQATVRTTSPGRFASSTSPIVDRRCGSSAAGG